MSRKTFKAKHLVAGLALMGATAFGATIAAPAFAQVDMAHHSTDASDGDTAHHQPFTVCSASGTDCRLVPVTGFDVTGRPLNGSNPTPVVNNDPDTAHHSTVNDGDAAHHRPYLVCTSATDCKYVPIPGFDVNGNYVGGNAQASSFFA